MFFPCLSVDMLKNHGFSVSNDLIWNRELWCKESGLKIAGVSRVLGQGSYIHSQKLTWQQKASRAPKGNSSKSTVSVSVATSGSTAATCTTSWDPKSPVRGKTTKLLTLLGTWGRHRELWKANHCTYLGIEVDGGFIVDLLWIGWWDDDVRIRWLLW